MVDLKKPATDPVDPQFQGYLDPKDRADQGKIIQALNDPEIAPGICLTLAINWILESIATGPATAWSTMAARDLVYFKQIGQNQKGYLAHFNSNGAKQAVDDLVPLSSRSARKVLKIFDGVGDEPLAAAVGKGLATSTTTPPTALVAFFGTIPATGETFGHAIAVAHKDGIAYLYDPNCGVFHVRPGAGSLDGLITKLFAWYRGKGLNPTQGFVAAIG